MKDIRITDNHPVRKRYILGPLGRFILKLINWDIIGNLPDKKRIIIASAPHSSSFDSIYAFFVCLASDLRFFFLGSISMFSRIVIPIPFQNNPDKLGRSSGKSGSDVERILAFHEIGRVDPIEYVESWESVLENALRLKNEFGG